MEITYDHTTATQLGFESTSRWLELVLPGAARQMDIRILDKDGNLLTTDPKFIDLTVYDDGEKIIWSGRYPSETTEIQKREDGAYFYLLNAGLSQADYMLYWTVFIGTGYTNIDVFQYAKVAKPRALMLLPNLRNQLDKSMKNVHEIHGWADDQLYLLLEGGVQEICKANPRVNYTLANYPIEEWWQLLIDSATLLGLISQGIFSIDSDLHYTDQGISFSVEHAGQINTYLGFLVTRFNESIQKFGLRHYAKPKLLMQLPRRIYGYQALVSAAPYGVSFPRIFGRQ